MKKNVVIALTLMLAVILCACANNDASQLGSTPSAEAEASEKELDAKLDEIFKDAEVQSNLPEDNGMAGVYKWVEMDDLGVKAYLILWDDGIGSIDMVGTGTVTGVIYNDETMQAADEGAVPQNYTYKDDTLTWTYSDEDGEHVSTFVKLTADERAAYEALGIGSKE
ncbi:MAG: hypothetical protein J6M92_11700 [Oribacterium sp.]|nr:hypothetical protein [Oribacterium sp.]